MDTVRMCLSYHLIVVLTVYKTGDESDIYFLTYVKIYSWPCHDLDLGTLIQADHHHHSTPQHQQFTTSDMAQLRLKIAHT